MPSCLRARYEPDPSLAACLCHSLGAHTRRKTLQSALQVLQVLLPIRSMMQPAERKL
jgi:hypothetical protein